MVEGRVCICLSVHELHLQCAATPPKRIEPVRGCWPTQSPSSHGCWGGFWQPYIISLVGHHCATLCRRVVRSVFHINWITMQNFCLVKRSRHFHHPLFAHTHHSCHYVLRQHTADGEWWQSRNLAKTSTHSFSDKYASCILFHNRKSMNEYCQICMNIATVSNLTAPPRLQ